MAMAPASTTSAPVSTPDVLSPAPSSKHTQTPSTPLLRVPNTRNPLPLSAAQEAQVRDIYYKRVRGYCADEVKEFATCARNRTITATWLCRSQRLAMNSCMLAHSGGEEMDRAREEWFQGRDERRAKREQEERTAEEKKKFNMELRMKINEEEERKRREKVDSGKAG